jgi:putative Mg2+ transporter-C (MgtC) family protein
MNDIIPYLTIHPYAWTAIVMVILCGGIIGLERQLRGKPVGIRTCILISLGTYVYVRTGTSLGSEHIDPSRVIGQIVVGVGFIGGGVIMNREGIVTGLTSAAVIWILAALGAVIGLHFYQAAIGLSVTVLSIILGIEFLEHRITWLRRGAHEESEQNRDREKSI